MLCYHILWTLAVLFCVPVFPFQRARRIRERLALRPPAFRPEPGCLWVHALSVGEVLSAVPLVRGLAQTHPGKTLVLTVTTKQGCSVARRELEKDVDLLLAMPMDFWAAYHRLVRFLRPAVFIPVETDLWPGLMHHLRRHKIPTVVVNGRISPRTAKAYRRFSPWSGFLLKGPALWLMQSDLDARRLEKSGVPGELVRVTGNIKFDTQWKPMEEGERRALRKALGLASGETVWIAGSTHAGEEEVILEVFSRLCARFSNLRLVLAPRRVERSNDVCRLARARGFQAARRSDAEFDKRKASVVILDTVGELGRIYGVGSMAFVGGSMVPVGGHNLLEPARFGLPTLFGPHMHNFAAMSEMLLEAEGGRRVESRQDLERAVDDLLARPEEALRMGERALGFVRMNQGALDRVLAEIEESRAHGV